MKQLNLVDIWKTTLIGCFLLLFFSCKSSKELISNHVEDEKKDVTQTSNYDLTKIDKLFTDLVINTDRKLDFIVFDTNKPITEGKPPVLVQGSLTDKSILTDKSVQEEFKANNSEVLIEDKGKVNIRDEFLSKEKRNNKTWIEQLTRLGVVVILINVGIYIKKRWS